MPIAHLLVLTSLVTAPSLAQADPARAAQHYLRQFAEQQLRQRPGPTTPDFPLAVDDSRRLKEAAIGTGFPVYTIDPNELLNGRGDLHASARPTGQWRFLVVLQGKAIGLATVEQVNGQYQTVSYGGAELSRDLEALAERHGNGDKSNLRFVRIYQARADLLEVAGADGHPRYAPLHSARYSLSMQMDGLADGAHLFEASDLLPSLRSAVKANITAFQ